ncbi:MAG: hypothetical protein RTU09_04160 [Candidatus Thorarchaeota archaeon]
MTVTEEDSAIPKVEETSEVKPEHCDIVKALEATEHLTNVYSNGLVLGIRTTGIPRTRGVHVEVVQVLDLRKAVFGRGGLAMQSAVLESVNRDLSDLLRDVGLAERFENVSSRTPWGRVPLLTLQSPSGKHKSLIHESRLVYVVSQDVRSSKDLSWLTDPRRIVSIHDFALARKSDARSIMPDLEKSLVTDKWEGFSKSVRSGWYGILAACASILGASTALFTLLLDSGNLAVPLAFMGICGAGAGWLLRKSREELDEFRKAIESERAKAKSLGDRQRVMNAIDGNKEKLRLIGDLSFVISPLMASAAKNLEEGDIDGAAVLAGKVLDEVVRLSPEPSEDKKSTVTGDAGIERFLGVFRTVGVDLTEAEEVSLALAYTAITGHDSTPIGMEEAMRLLAILNTSLFDAGVLSLTVRGSIDDMLISRACDTIVDEFGEDLAKPEEAIVQVDKEADEIGSALEETLGDIAESGPAVKVQEEPDQEVGVRPEGEFSEVESEPVPECDGELETESVSDSIEGKKDATEQDEPATGADVTRIMERPEIKKKREGGKIAI